MIKSKNSNVTLKGTGKELLIDYLSIDKALKSIMPGEMVENAHEIIKKAEEKEKE